MSTSMMMTLFGNKVVRKNDWKWFNCGLINGRRESITPLFLSHTHTLSLCICATPKMFELCWSPNGMGFLPLLSPSRRTNFWAPNENIIQDKKRSSQFRRMATPYLPALQLYLHQLHPFQLLRIWAIVSTSIFCKFHHQNTMSLTNISMATLCWSKALWLDVVSHMTFLTNQSKWFISA